MAKKIEIKFKQTKRKSKKITQPKFVARKSSRTQKVLKAQLNSSKKSNWTKQKIKIAGVKRLQSEKQILYRLKTSASQKTNKKYALGLARLKIKQAKNTIQKQYYKEVLEVTKRKFNNKSFKFIARGATDFQRMSKDEYISLYGEESFLQLESLEQGWYFGLVDQAREIIVYLS